MKQILFYLSAVLIFSSCTENKDWNIYIPDTYSSSSPKAIDLTGDGILDIVMGGGSDEWAKSDYGIIAVNGADGSLMWNAPARNQIVGTPVFLDLNNDKTPDVIIGGRSAELQALNGKTGEQFWEFYSNPKSTASRDDGWYNFYNPQIVADQDQDGIKDILICNGGDAVIPKGYNSRPPGKLMLISSKTGKTLAEDFMPDMQETYFSPVLINPESENPQIIFGSGGESEPGHLYLCRLSDLLDKNLKVSRVIDSTLEKGYEAPPIMVDMNKDGIKDLLFNTNEGFTKLLNGKDFSLIWSYHMKGTEVFSQPAVGLFNDDDYLDVFVQYNHGIYPVYDSTSLVLIDGKSGKEQKRYFNKRFTYSSPLVVDLNNDGRDEVLLNSVSDSLIENKPKPFFEIQLYDFQKDEVSFIAERKDGACFASTPWIGDIDQDGKLDIIYSGSPSIISEFPGYTAFQKPQKYLGIYRRDLEYPADKIRWSSYMGKDAKSHLD
ncbi:hypothetical protein [Jiulongibacter sp. NS-SX5]|uniref:hypothetical protein n=1 Tax=Jiulongibacter sp. NS-SX5 TaxID=3463854 RepID=UPI004057E7F6